MDDLLIAVNALQQAGEALRKMAEALREQEAHIQYLDNETYKNIQFKQELLDLLQKHI